MTLKTPLLFALALAAGVASAAEVPSPTAFPTVDQQKTLSVQHWTVIANDLATSTLSSLGEQASAGIYIAEPTNETAFDKSLHTFLVDSFHKAGAKVYTKAHEGALTVDVNSSLTSHLSKADSLPPFMATALMAGVLVVREITFDNLRSGLLAASLGQDLLRPYDKPVSRTEVAVSVSVTKGDVYAARHSNVYYVDNADASLFRSTGKTLRIQGGN